MEYHAQSLTTVDSQQKLCESFNVVVSLILETFRRFFTGIKSVKYFESNMSNIMFFFQISKEVPILIYRQF